MYITEEMKERVVGKKVSFDYNGKHMEKEVQEVVDVIHGTWIGDLGFEDDNDSNSDSFILHGNTDENNLPIMEGLVVQYDSADGTRHGYVNVISLT
jgi:hypothetical protein